MEKQSRMAWRNQVGIINYECSYYSSQPTQVDLAFNEETKCVLTSTENPECRGHILNCQYKDHVHVKKVVREIKEKLLKDKKR